MNYQKYQQVRSIIANVLQVPIEQITEETSSESSDKWDSIAHINICLSIQQEFGFDMSLDELESTKSVQAFMSLLSQHRGPAAE